MRIMLRYTGLIWLMIAAQAVPQPRQNLMPAVSGDLDVYESVVRYQIKSWDLAASTFCIEVDGKDADETLLNRLRPLPVKAASGCDRESGRVKDKETKKAAVIFDIEEIRRISDSKVEVEGGYWCGSQCMAEGVYHAVHEGPGWRVTSFDMKIIA